MKTILLKIRLITNISDRAELFESHSILLHFFEGSLAAYYFIGIGAIVLIYLIDKKGFSKDEGIFMNSLLIMFIIIFFFHRSTTFLVLLLTFSFLFLLKSKNILYFFLALIIFSLFIYSSQLFKKFIVYISGNFLDSDIYRFTSILSVAL